MRRFPVGLCLLLLGVPLSADDRPPAPLPIRLELGNEVVTPNGGAIRAFVPTGSQSGRCLLTFGDTNYPFYTPTGFVGAWQAFCGPRQLNGQNGVLISVFPSAPFSDGLYVSLTVWQGGARYYGAPVFYCPADNPNC